MLNYHSTKPRCGSRSYLQLSNELAALLPSLLNDLDLDEKAFTAYVLKLTDLDDGLDTADLALELGVLSLIIARLYEYVNSCSGKQILLQIVELINQKDL